MIGFSYAENEEVKAQYTKTENGVGGSWVNSRADNLSLFKTGAESQGWQKYIRLSKHDGNLVESGWVNQGQLADGYISGPNFPMIWPKGSGISYGYVFVFYVAGEVKDARGNTIHIVSDRFHRGNIEQSPDKTHWYDFKPLPKFFNNHHLGISEWDIGGVSEDVGVDGIANTHDFGEGDGELQIAEDFNRNGVLDLSLINVYEWAAMSNLRETWPEYWPAQTYPGDDRPIGTERPGIRAGRWNGEYGAYVRADQESFYYMDDHENDEFEYYPFMMLDTTSGEYVPDDRPWPDGKRGLGITVKVRNYQWSARLAEDLLISIYDIINYGRGINKAIVGMYSDVDVGGSSGGDDADFDTKDDITYVWDLSGISTQGLPTGYFGFAFLESPGLPDNRKDDDEDGMIDESQTNKIDDDGDWRPWEDLNGNGKWDPQEPVWDDVGSDGIGPEDEGYSGPDANGTEINGIPDLGEPNYETTDNDESDQVGMTSWYLKDVDSRMADDEAFWTTEIQPGTFEIDPEYTRDVAFSYGSGYIPLNSGRSGQQRYAIATLFGNDMNDIFRNKRTMQKIYDSDYNFSKPPRRPVVTTVVSDKKVILFWDKSAEESKDPIYGKDFEMYKIYKSTDAQFSDIKTISDAFGNPLLFKPLVQYDLKDGLFGAHPVPIGELGVSYDMGTDSGLEHSYVDTMVTNGRTYYYAVVSVDKGYDSDFYDRGLSDREGLAPNSPTECSAVIQTDPLGRPTFIDRNCAVVTPSEPPAGYLEPQTENGIDHTFGLGTGSIKLEVYIPDSVKTDHEYEITFLDDSTFEFKDSTRFHSGNTVGAWLVDITDGDTLLTPDFGLDSLKSAEVLFDGFKLSIMNDDTVDVDWQGWVKGKTNIIGEALAHAQETFAVPRDYEIRVGEMGMDSSYSMVPGRARKTNFSVYDITDPENAYPVIFGLAEDEEPDSLKGVLSVNDEIAIKISPLVIPMGGDTLYIYTETSWRIRFSMPRGIEDSLQILPEAGDIFRFTSKKPFNRYDVFNFTMVGGDFQVARAKTMMDNIYTVPDPYIAASSLEPKLVNQSVGRGERKIEFVNLPEECKISIFTISGRLVRELYHNASDGYGREPWDLRTKDGLEIAHGIYIYHVDAPGIGQKVGKLAIIK